MMVGEIVSFLIVFLLCVNICGQVERLKMFLGYIVKYCVKKYVYVRKVKFIFQFQILKKILDIMRQWENVVGKYNLDLFIVVI